MNRRLMIITAALAALSWFALLGYRDLIDPDEGRYAEISREMVASGDWLTPRLNGYKYFEKPALQYWATAAALTLGGNANGAARIWPALTGFLCALFVWFIGARLYGPQAGFAAFIITLNYPLFVAMGQILTLDMAVSAFLVVAVTALSLAQSRRAEPAPLRNWMLVAWAACALAVLSKGLIGLVLPGGAVVCYSLWQRDWALWKNLHLGKGLLLFLALTAPWFIAVSLKNPEFAPFFFIHEHFARFTSNVHQRQGAPWYFVPLLLGGTLPWLSVTLKGLFAPGFSWRGGDEQGFNAERFLWVFAVVVFAFFSKSHSKLPPYILPILPVLAILAGKRLAAQGGDRISATLMLALGLLMLGAAPWLEHFASVRTPAALFAAFRPWLIGSGLLLLLGGALAWRSDFRQPRHLAAVGLAVLLALLLPTWGYQALATTRSCRELAGAIRAKAPQATEIFAVETSDFPHSLPFYLEKTMTMVGYKGEMEMGIDAEPGNWLSSGAEFAARWQAAATPVAVLDQAVLAKYQAMGVPMLVIFESPRRIAVVKP
ncbi:MAG: glycosyltransferase family 39 protein [Desulfobulbaceae bacterium]|nr:glycosyltransferase family 39 protein [Desulfobulbaceae bacterium]